MKRFPLIVLVMVSLLTAAFSQKERYAERPPKSQTGLNYPIKIHLSGIHLRTDCNVSDWNPGYAHCNDAVYADARLNGMKIELMGYGHWTKDKASDPIGLGDYQARLIKGLPKNVDSPIGEQYELVLADGTIWRVTVTGISE